MNIKTTLMSSVAAAALMAAVAPAQAGSVNSGDKVSISLSGQINKAFLYFDDGKETETAIVDNDNSGSRFRIVGSGKVNEATSVGTIMEVEFQDNESNKLVLDDSNAAGNTTTNAATDTFGQTFFNQRRMEAYIDSKPIGRLSIGQGPTASDGTAETNLSGAGLAAGGGIFFLIGTANIRDSSQADNTFGSTTWGGAFTNLDGASRTDRVRYDSPNFAGFKVATSYLSDGRADAALSYGGKMAGFTVNAKASYLNSAAASTTVDSQWVVSGAAEHNSGLNVRGHFGQADKAPGNTNTKKTTAWNISGGYDAKLTSYGETSFAIGYTVTEDITANGQEANMIDFGVVQHLSGVGTELYVGAQLMEYDDATSTNFENATAIFAGTRIKF